MAPKLSKGMIVIHEASKLMNFYDDWILVEYIGEKSGRFERIDPGKIFNDLESWWCVRPGTANAKTSWILHPDTVLNCQPWSDDNYYKEIEDEMQC